MAYNIPENIRGLSDDEVVDSQRKYGFNEVDVKRSGTAWRLMLDIIKEPMLLILVAIAMIYAIVGNYVEALFMLGAIIAVSGISFHQDSRSRKALNALKKMNEPLSTVVRNSRVAQIPTSMLAVGDFCIVEEGKMINADGRVVYSNDFRVNEAALTGESLSVYKNTESPHNDVYGGTLVVSGLAVFRVEHIGKETQFGKIGHSINDIRPERSPLQIQIDRFVKRMALIGVVIFALVCAYSFSQSGDALHSVLSGLTLAMSILPEEIPVAFSTFMALGAWKMMRDGVIVKRSSVVETLGSTTVICADKTGTITENSMHLKLLFDYKANRIFDDDSFKDAALSELISFAMWSSEPLPFDPMEQALHQVYEQTQPKDMRPDHKLIREYPLEGNPPMMTHIFESASGERIGAAKGAPESILDVCRLSGDQKAILLQRMHDFGKMGYRVLGVAKCIGEDFGLPEKQRELQFEFLGFTVFHDPPKKGIQEVFRKIYQAGIKVKVVTGDNADTTQAIAQEAGITNESVTLNGTEIIDHSGAELLKLSQQTTLFARMFPEAKLKLVNAFREDGEVVAMLGDGVNDAPALRAANIGVAMGTKGTEIAKAAASLILIHDDLEKLITGIASGRRIYDNLKKAVQYIISIHIPIILTVSLPLFLNWIYPNIFTPVHVIFLELIMGPTCSIVYENEPIEKNAMQQKPRKMSDTFLNWNEISISVIQGTAITLGTLITYQFSVQTGGDEEQTRAMVFSALIFSNVLLSLVNRSFYYSVFKSMKNKNNLFPIITGTTLLLLVLILYIPAIAAFFRVSPLGARDLGFVTLVACISVLWFEIYKWTKRRMRGMNRR